MTTNALKQQKPVDDAFIAEHNLTVQSYLAKIIVAAHQKQTDKKAMVSACLNAAIGLIQVSAYPYRNVFDFSQVTEVFIDESVTVYQFKDNAERTDYVLIQQDLHDLLQQILEL